MTKYSFSIKKDLICQLSEKAYLRGGRNQCPGGRLKWGLEWTLRIQGEGSHGFRELFPQLPPHIRHVRFLTAKFLLLHVSTERCASQSDNLRVCFLGNKQYEMIQILRCQATWGLIMGEHFRIIYLPQV